MISQRKRFFCDLVRNAGMQRMYISGSVRNWLVVCNICLTCLSLTIFATAWTISPHTRARVHNSGAFQKPQIPALCVTRLRLYLCGGDQNTPHSSMTNSTRLYYKDDKLSGGGNATLELDCSTANFDDTAAANESTSSSIDPSFSSKGTFGDIMSPTIGDADLFFRDGLVTSETYSLEGTYGITNPLDRMAVTANGNLQRLFSSYYDAPVLVDVEHCTRQPNSAKWSRRVSLKIFDQIFCTADSIVVVHSKEVEELVESGKVGIGQLFRHFNTLPEFSLLCAGPTSNGGIWRNYTLESGLVTCSIREVFCSGLWELSPLSEYEL